MRLNNKYLTVIIIALLIFSALVPAIALSAQLEERGLNDTGTAMPDLVVEEITVSSPLYQNETAQINATIRGNGTDASQFNVSFLVDGTLREEKTIESLNENSTKEISFNWIPDEAKNYSLTIIADSNKEINESNETNNELEVEVAVLMRITVVINDSDKNYIHIQDLSLKANVSILNATAIACENLNMSFNSSGGNVTWIDGLENPKLFLYNKEKEEWNETGIEHELEDRDIIGWSGENDLPLMFSDITPENLTIISFGGTAYPNVTNEIEVKIGNNGLVNASNFSCVFGVNDEFVSEQEIASLNRTEEKTSYFSWIPDHTGNYTLSVEVDPQNNISELNETNNNISINVTVREVTTIRVPTDYPTIQEAIDAAPPGSRIYLEDGEYCIADENNIVRIANKSNLLIFGSKDAKVVLTPETRTHIEAIRIERSENITLSGFWVEVIEDARFGQDIVIVDSRAVTLSNFTLYNKAHNCWNSAVVLSNSSKCKIKGCTFNVLHYGTQIQIVLNSAGNLIENNTIESIYMVNTTNNTLCNNKISKLWLGGDARCWSVPKGNNSDNNTIYNNKIEGISILGDNNILHNNIIFSLGFSSGQIVYPFNGSNNTIYLNNIFGRGEISGNNSWNSTTPVSYTYNGTTRTNNTGNFWFDYSGVDNNCDGIGDLRYEVCTDNYDYHPLIGPYGLTFDLAVTAITRPYITYADRNNTILVTIGRTGTYPSPEDVNVSFMANDAEVDSKIVRVGLGEKVVNFTWIPQDVGDYNLSVKVHPEDELLSEMDDTNNEFSIDVVVSPPLFDCGYTAEISSALDFLNGTQLVTGAIWGFENSGWAALGIIAAGEDPSTGRWKPPGRDSRSLIGYLRKEPEDLANFLGSGVNPPDLTMPSDFARMVMVISAIGEDPTNFGGVNYLTMLKSYYDGEQFRDPEGPFDIEDDALAILALISSGDNDPRTEDMIMNASRYIKDRPNADGGWSSFGVDSDVGTTSIVIQALIAAGEDKNSPVVITNGLSYLKNAQDKNGGYPENTSYTVKTTSYAIHAFIAAEEDPLNYSKTIDYLLSLQQPDGSFNDTTTFSIFALCAEPYPVMVKTMREDYELSDISVSDIVTEDEICVNTSYTVKANIRSNGGIFHANLLSDGEFVGREEVPSVWYVSLTPVSFTWKPNTTGDHNLTIFADSMNNITESDEENNNATKKVEVVYPDLYPGRITPPVNVFVNITNVIDCTINGTTDESFTVTLEAEDGEFIGEKIVKRVRGSETISFNWRPSENKTYILKLTANPDEDLKEREYGNNSLSKSVNVSLTDLKPRDLRAEEEVYVNARNFINLTVKGMAESFNISLIENGTIVGKTTNVTCYGERNVTVYWKPTTLGNHTVTAFVDSDDDIEETNETNNNLSDVFEVVRPDIVPVAIEPNVYYIDEFNDVNVGVNGTAERFNVTLLVNYTGVDRSGSLSYLIRPIVNQTPYEGIEIPATGSESNFTCNITGLKDEWSWDDIRKLDLEIGSVSETGMLDGNDLWGIDYAALFVNCTENETLELAPGNVTSTGNWSNTSEILLPDGVYARTENITTLLLEMSDPPSPTAGNITSVTVLLKGHVSNMHTPTAHNYNRGWKNVNTDTYNHTIEFGWVPWYEGIYNLTVFLDPDNDINETNEENNVISKEVLATTRIKLELTSPLGSETWKGIQNIAWNASYETSLLYGTTLLIDIFYSPDRSSHWIPIATNENNTGVYSWNTEKNVQVDGEYMVMILAHPGEISWGNSHYCFYEIIMTLAQSSKPWAMDMSEVFYIRNKKTGEEWGSFHENAGYAPCDGPDTNKIAWMSEDIGAASSSSLIVAKGKVFVYASGEHGNHGSGATHLYALNEKTGKFEWKKSIPGGLHGSWATPVYNSGSVFMSCGDGIARLNAEDGHNEWPPTIFHFPSKQGAVDGGPAVTKRAIYAGDWAGCHYYCIENNRTKPKEVLWTFSSEGRAQSTPAIAYGNVYFGSFCMDMNCHSKAFCVDAVEGTEIWSTETGDVCGSVTVADGRIYFTTYGDDSGRHFYALDSFTGSEIWASSDLKYVTDSTPAYYSPSKSTRSYIYVSQGDSASTRATFCFDAKTGKPIWSKGGVGYWTASPIVTRDGKVFVGTTKKLYCLDAFTGDTIWESYGGPSPVVVNGFVYTVYQGRVIAYGNGTMPDLTVEVNKPDEKFVVEKEGNINATIKNIGESNVTKSFKVVLRYKGDVIDEQTVDSPLNINDSKEVPFEWTPEKPGEPCLTVEVDPPPGNVSESDPWNNMDNVTVFVEDNKPDLISSISAPETILVGETVPVGITIENKGYETNELFFVRFFDNMDTSEEPLISWDVNTKSISKNFTWTAPGEPGRYRLTVLADSRYDVDENVEDNNRDWVYVNVTEEEEEDEDEDDSIGFGPGSRGGHGGGDEGGIGEGSGIGEAGAGEAGGMQIPVNASGSANENKKEVSGYPFGNATSGASGGGGTLPALLILLAILVITPFYLGYYKEKRAHAKQVSPGAYRRNRNKK